jgi:hypothetical protein
VGVELILINGRVVQISLAGRILQVETQLIISHLLYPESPITEELSMQGHVQH